MRVAVIVVAAFAILGLPTNGQPDEKLLPPTGSDKRVVVNSQQPLVDAVGDGFRDEAWEYPAGLLPRTFPELTYVSGPGDRGLSPKAAWRKPVVLKGMASQVELSVNCYRRREAQVAGIGGHGGTPFASLVEPDYRYKPAQFHDLPAAAASEKDWEVFAFRDGNLLFKVEAIGGKAEARREVLTAVVEAIWKFRHPN